MAYMRLRTLVVLILLQLHRAEISNTAESWYSANVISDGFQPKPISEIFSTEATFSSTNPIIVLPKSSTFPDDIEVKSTIPPPTPQVTITSTSGALSQPSSTPSPFPTKTTTIAALQSHLESSSSLPQATPTVTLSPPMPTIQSVTQAPSSLPPEVHQEVVPLSPTASDYDQSLTQFQPEQFEFVPEPENPTYEISQPSLESLFQSLNQEPYMSIMSIQSNNQSESGMSQEQPISPQITTKEPTLLTEVTTFQSTIPQSSLPTQTSILQSSSPFLEPSSTPIPILVQSSSSEIPRPQSKIVNREILKPQIIQGLPVPSNSGQWQQIKFEVVPQSSQSLLSQPNQSVTNGQSVSTQQPLSNYFMIYQQAPQTFQNYPLRQLMGPSPPLSPATLPPPPPSNSPLSPSTVPPSLSTSLRSTTFSPLPTVVTQVPPQTTRPPVSTHQPITSISPPTITTANPSFYTSRPFDGAMPSIPIVPMRIRVVSPSGSITNIQIRPKLISTSTTRRPTTTRTRKPRPKKNTYDYCVNSCKGPAKPICAAPISASVIDPETLKGFPSICHMACHNSYRKKPYQMVADGRCGRLRLKIRPLDSKAKLKKNELVKTEYSIDHTGQKAVIEVSSGVRP